MVAKRFTAAVGIISVCWILSIIFLLHNAYTQSAIPANVSFAAESNSMYFLDRGTAKIYKYNIQGRLVRIYVVTELGKDLILK